MKIYTLEFEKPITELEQTLEALRKQADEQKIDLSAQIQSIEEKLETTKKEIFTSLTPWQRVQLARHPKRPYMLDYLQRIATDFIELHGDRRFADDHAIVGGLATIGERRVMVIGQQKGRDTKENLMRNFGSPHPEGYRKALRLMQLAEKFELPGAVLHRHPRCLSRRRRRGTPHRRGHRRQPAGNDGSQGAVDRRGHW